MRLFLASSAYMENLEKLRQNFPMIEARWTPKENFHLTYHFLGDAYRPETIIEKLQGIEYVKKYVPLTGLGNFGKPPRILYANATDETLLSLHDEIEKRLDFQTDRPFKPHITLARIKKADNMSAFKKVLEDYKNEVLGEIYTELKLFKSILTNQGAHYEEIHTF